MIRIEIHGLDKLIKDVESMADEKKYQKLQHDLTLWMKKEAKRLCPVDTGHMRRTIYMRRLSKYSYEYNIYLNKIIIYLYHHDVSPYDEYT